MQTLEMHNPVYVDVDGTLIRDSKSVKVFDERFGSYNFIAEAAINVPHPYRGNEPVPKVPMLANINLLKDMHTRGRTIVVWSQAGYLWAEAVVHALELCNFVHYVAEKPIAYIDDLEASNFMGQRIFLHD